MNETLQTIAQRSSIRAYTDQKLSREQLETLVQAGLMAPTARNAQEIHITVVDGEHPILAQIEAEKNAGRGLTNPPHNFYYEAPAVLLLSAGENYGWEEVDAGIAVENIALAAESMGLGSLIIGCIRDALTGPREADFSKELGFPEGYRFIIAIAVGYPAVQKKQHEFDMETAVNYL